MTSATQPQPVPSRTVRTANLTPLATTTVISRLPAAVDLILYAGDDFTLAITVNNGDGTPADLSGAVIRSQIRTTPQNSTILGEFDPTINGNVITLDLPGEVSTILPARCAWDCEMVINDRTTTLTAGNVTMTPEVTR